MKVSDVAVVRSTLLSDGRDLTSGCTCQNAGHRLSRPYGRLHGVLQVNRGR
jgi:hypothetical protein